MKSDLINHKFYPSKGLSIILAIALLMFSIVSCDKDDDVVLTNTQYLTSSPWIIEGVNSGDASVDAEFLSFLSNATFTFETAGTYIFTFLNDPTNNGDGIWEFNAAETLVILDKGSTDQDDWTVMTLNSTQFKFSIVDSSAGAVEITFKH